MNKAKWLNISSIIFLGIVLIILYLFMNNSSKSNIKTKESIDKDVYIYENTPTKDSKNEIENSTVTYSQTSKDIIGNISISETNIDSKLVQAKDNSYYLDHDVYGNYDVYGSIFLDYRNSMSDRKLLIYGHNARNLSKTPFYELEKYLREDFFNSHQYIILNINDENSKWQIFSIQILPKDDTIHTQIRFSDVKWVEHLKWMKVNSIYETGVLVEESDQILTLQTCNYNEENTFIVVNAKRI
ncbi:MAG: class B sortase [bacterium]|nr:class B sortase [bacterium]